MQPFKIYRNKKGWPKWYQPLVEAYWIITGKWSLHKAWQYGLDKGRDMEYERIIKNMGEIDAQRRNVMQAELNKVIMPSINITDIN